MSHGSAEVDGRILDLIRERLSIDVDDLDTDLIETGLIDSLGLVMLISVLEESYACELPLDDFEIDNFRSARRIAVFLDESGVLGARDLW